MKGPLSLLISAPGCAAPPPLRGRVGWGVQAQTCTGLANTPTPSIPLPARGRGDALSSKDLLDASGRGIEAEL
jgi:hypothetical protein